MSLSSPGTFSSTDLLPWGCAAQVQHVPIAGTLTCLTASAGGPQTEDVGTEGCSVSCTVPPPWVVERGKDLSAAADNVHVSEVSHLRREGVDRRSQAREQQRRRAACKPHRGQKPSNDWARRASLIAASSVRTWSAPCTHAVDDRQPAADAMGWCMRD